VVQVKRYGARGPLSDPPQLGESVVVLAWEAEAAIATVAEAAVEQIIGSDEDTRAALTEAFQQGERDMLDKCIATLYEAAFDEKNRLNTMGSGTASFCCSCEENTVGVLELINVLKALGEQQ
jgi:hypothetical protein